MKACPKGAVLLLPTAVILLGAAACTASAEDQGSPPIELEISDAQRQAIADGMIDEAEYEAGFRRYLNCMKDQGYEVIELGRDRQVLDYAIPETASEADAFCYPFEFREVDSMWQIAHIDGSETADMLRACLVRYGIDPADTVVEMEVQLLDGGLTPGDC